MFCQWKIISHIQLRICKKQTSKPGEMDKFVKLSLSQSITGIVISGSQIRSF